MSLYKTEIRRLSHSKIRPSTISSCNRAFTVNTPNLWTCFARQQWAVTNPTIFPILHLPNENRLFNFLRECGSDFGHSKTCSAPPPPSVLCLMTSIQLTLSCMLHKGSGPVSFMTDHLLACTSAHLFPLIQAPHVQKPSKA